MGPKRAWLEKEYLPSEWTSDANILMADVQGGDLSDRKKILKIEFLTKNRWA